MDDRNIASVGNRRCKEAVCIHTDKVYDSCREWECTGYQTCLKLYKGYIQREIISPFAFLAMVFNLMYYCL